MKIREHNTPYGCKRVDEDTMEVLGDCDTSPADAPLGRPDTGPDTSSAPDFSPDEVGTPDLPLPPEAIDTDLAEQAADIGSSNGFIDGIITKVRSGMEDVKQGYEEAAPEPEQWWHGTDEFVTGGAFQGNWTDPLNEMSWPASKLPFVPKEDPGFLHGVGEFAQGAKQWGLSTKEFAGDVGEVMSRNWFEGVAYAIGGSVSWGISKLGLAGLLNYQKRVKMARLMEPEKNHAWDDGVKGVAKGALFAAPLAFFSPLAYAGAYTTSQLAFRRRAEIMLRESQFSPEELEAVWKGQRLDRREWQGLPVIRQCRQAIDSVVGMGLIKKDLVISRNEYDGSIETGDRESTQQREQAIDNIIKLYRQAENGDATAKEKLKRIPGYGSEGVEKMLIDPNDPIKKDIHTTRKALAKVFPTKGILEKVDEDIALDPADIEDDQERNDLRSAYLNMLVRRICGVAQGEISKEQALQGIVNAGLAVSETTPINEQKYLLSRDAHGDIKERSKTHWSLIKTTKKGEKWVEDQTGIPEICNKVLQNTVVQRWIRSVIREVNQNSFSKYYNNNFARDYSDYPETHWSKLRTNAEGKEDMGGETVVLNKVLATTKGRNILKKNQNTESFTNDRKSKSHWGKKMIKGERVLLSQGLSIPEVKRKLFELLDDDQRRSFAFANRSSRDVLPENPNEQELFRLFNSNHLLRLADVYDDISPENQEKILDYIEQEHLDSLREIITEEHPTRFEEMSEEEKTKIIAELNAECTQEISKALKDTLSIEQLFSDINDPEKYNIIEQMESNPQIRPLIESAVRSVLPPKASDKRHISGISIEEINERIEKKFAKGRRPAVAGMAEDIGFDAAAEHFSNKNPIFGAAFRSISKIFRGKR